MATINRALVLSGGNVKGAYQAGAIKTVIDSGFRPQAIFGISVGALNGGFLADQRGQEPRVDWPQAADNLIKFWKDEITGFSSIGKERKTWKLAIQVLRKKFDGFLKMDKLDKLMPNYLRVENMVRSDIPFLPGVVEMESGKFFYATVHPDFAEAGDEKTIEIRLDQENFFKYILASTREPVKMPVDLIGEKTVADGGVRNIAPLKSAIDHEAVEIITISNQWEVTAPQSGKNYRDLFTLAFRTVGIMLNEIVNNDLHLAQKINLACIEYGEGAANQFKIDGGLLDGYRYVESTIIRPKESLGIDVLNFNSDDIKGMIEKGQAAAEVALQERDQFRIDIGYTPPQN